MAIPPASARSSISQNNWQYNVNATKQDSAGHIPRALWENYPLMQKVL